MSGRVWPHLVGAVTLTLTGAIWLIWQGPQPVMRGSEVLAIAVPFWYMLLAFPFFGVLLAESWLERNTTAGRILFTQTLALFLLSATRLALHIPVSGHILLLVFFLLWSLSRREQPYLTEFVITLVALALLLYTKIIVWQDWTTVIWGVALAFLIWLPGQLVSARKKRR